MAKMTPGPWRGRMMGSEGGYIWPDTGDKREDMKHIAIVNGRDFLTDQENLKAIAAVPDLIAALTELLEVIEWSESGSREERAYDAGRAALVKAGV